MSSRPVKVFFVCSGLGRVHRGFESFLEECFEVLSRSERFQCFLFSGKSRGRRFEKSPLSLSRTSLPARLLARLFKRDAYWIEQISFAIGLLPFLYLRRPDLIVLSDGNLANALYYIREVLRLPFRILFSNGAPFQAAFLPRADHIHQVTQKAYEEACIAGIPAHQQSSLPYGFHIPRKFSSPPREALRSSLYIPTHSWCLISVAAINREHKRMDYLIYEFAKLTQAMQKNNPFLLILGSPDKDAPAILKLAAQELPAGSFSFRQVSKQEVPYYLLAADCFALCSLEEGFGRAAVEACAAGLPCVIHEESVLKELLGKHAYTVDMREPGALAQKLLFLSQRAHIHEKRRSSLALQMYGRYSWDSLQGAYENMFLSCAWKR